MRPLAIQQVDWPTYIDTCKSVLGYSPIRGIDSQNLDIKKPGTYLATLDLSNNCSQVLDSYRHIFCSFIGTASLKTLLELQSTKLAVRYKEADTLYLVILSGTLDIWIESLRQLEQSRTETQHIREEILGYLKTANLLK
jgi:hypothetical protein